jgi:hypothetical protein
MKSIVLALGVALVVSGCKEETKPAHTTEYDQAVVTAHAESSDCAVLRPGIEGVQQRLSDKAHSAYSAKAFEELAAMRDAAVKDAAQWKLMTERAQKIAAAWSALNVRGAVLERRVAASIGDAGAAGGAADASPDAPDASSVADDMMALAQDESRLSSDLDKLCPNLAPL